MPSFNFRGRRYNNPAELALFLLGGKWKMPILWRLKDGVRRYGEMKRSLGPVTHKVLAQQLRQLERDGFVMRTVHPVVPPRVEYAISELGRSSLAIIGALRQWGDEYRRQHGNRLPAPDNDATR